MSITILDGFEGQNPIMKIFKDLLEERAVEFSDFTLRDMNIQPCRSCGSCSLRTPGECILDDEMHVVLRALARSKTIIFLSPVRFGGYSSELKKAMDRTALMVLPLYVVKKGSLLHPIRYDEKSLFLIGEIEDDIPGQEENFKLILERNALNMQSSNKKVLIFNKSEDAEKIKKQIESELKEVIV